MYGEGWYSIGNKPANTTFTEIKSPDRVPSFSMLAIRDRGKDVVEVLEVKNENGQRIGALVLAARSDLDDPSGKLRAHGVSVFTAEEIQSCQE